MGNNAEGHNNADVVPQESVRDKLLGGVSACLAAAPEQTLSLETRVLAHAGLSTDVVVDAFGSFGQLIDVWFTERLNVTLDQARAIEVAPGSTFGERIEALTFILLDNLDPYPGADQALFRRYAAPLRSAFRKRLTSALGTATSSPDVPAVNQLVVDSEASRFLLADVVIRLVEESLADDTADRSRSAALVDRSLALASAVATDPVAQRLTDLIRYAWEAEYFAVQRIPFIGDLFRDRTDGESDG